MMLFDIALALAAVAAGTIASVAGFGIGSMLTPLLAARVGTRLAVAAVSIPHLFGTAIRFWVLRGNVHRQTFLWFGLTSAGGSLAGALLHEWASNRALSIVLGGLLLFVAWSQWTGMMDRVRVGRGAAWIAGAVSGTFGGLVGNQGGIRSAALLAFDLDKASFVATATAVGLIVDAARMPIYIVAEREDLWRIAPLIAVLAAAVVAGTLIGSRLLGTVSDRQFRRMIAVLLFALGTWMLFHG
jgi:uncharacterized membrane protein YfcA